MQTCQTSRRLGRPTVERAPRRTRSRHFSAAHRARARLSLCRARLLSSAVCASLPARIADLNSSGVWSRRRRPAPPFSPKSCVCCNIVSVALASMALCASEKLRAPLTLASTCERKSSSDCGDNRRKGGQTVHSTFTMMTMPRETQSRQDDTVITSMHNIVMKTR